MNSVVFVFFNQIIVYKTANNILHDTYMRPATIRVTDGLQMDLRCYASG